MGIAERKEREKEQRKNDIIDAAEKIFFTRGFDNATMDDVAEEAELSKATLYLYFKSKEDLHFAICIRALLILIGMFKEAVSDSKSAFENLLEIGKTYVAFAHKHTSYFKAMLHFESKELHGTDCSSCLLGDEDNCPLMFLIETIRKGQNDKSVRSDISAEIMGHILWSQTTGVLQVASVKKCDILKEKITAESLIYSHFEILKTGIKGEKNV
jgi:TetR/AcrR family transcriptional regulator